MTTIATVNLQVLPPKTDTKAKNRACLVLVGNPNAGKTTLFNALTGLRAKTANFPGTTIEHRTGRVTLGGEPVELLDIPGLYGLNAATHEEVIACDAIRGQIPGQSAPDGVILIIDATNLERNLFLAGQVLEMGLPTVVALNMIDLAEKSAIRIDVPALSKELGCPVVPISARSGRGLEELRRRLEEMIDPQCKSARSDSNHAACASCQGCPFQARYDWAETVGAKVQSKPAAAMGRRTEAIDRVLTHPWVGVAAFMTVMVLVFAMIFWLAQYPMDLIDGLFAWAGGYVGDAVQGLASLLPPSAIQTFVREDLHSLLVQGVVGGVGGVLIFLPQICILFLFLSLLEDTGYLARAAFVMDRLMGRVGLPGKAFVPMLSAHACAIPAIMAARVIEDRRDRLMTILILPLMTCSARIPVYAMVVALIFPGSFLLKAAVFTGAYFLGVATALVMALLFKRTILPGEPRPLVLELPSYKMPSLRNALLCMFDRAWVFVTKAGTIILLASVILWAVSYYPKVEPKGDSPAQKQQYALSHSLAGRVGHFIEPVIRPLGYDWQIGIGLISSFAAREVFVSTMAIVYGVGDEDAEQNPQRFYQTLQQAQRSDGSPVFTTATCVSVLIFYVLAMQCVSTLATTKRETGSWKWPLFQLAYMSVLAYVGALAAYQLMTGLNIS